MKAFHSFWSKPNSVRNQGTVCIPDFELLTTILSALEWKKHNGPISLITDKAGYAYFKKLGIHQLYEHIDLSLNEMNQRTDPIVFWAAGKLHALKTMDLPCVMLDTDLIIWKNMDYIKEYDIVAAHMEDLNPYVYPDPSNFILSDGYSYPEEWNFSLPAANTAFLYMKDASFRDYYVDHAMSFFKHVSLEGLDTISAMCFAEQRVLPMCADAKKKKIGYLLSLDYPEMQDFITHTWGYKDILRNDEKENRIFCERCMKRIIREFPDTIVMLDQSGLLKKYFVLDALDD